MKNVFFLLLLFPCVCFAAGADHWSAHKNTNAHKGVGTTSCEFYNQIDQKNKSARVMNDLYKQWMDGWVSSFAMYSNWEVRDIDDAEYLVFLKNHCEKFPKSTIGMAAHAFAFSVKK
jgi:hypothetical protein